jgi:hypothetical protein
MMLELTPENLLLEIQASIKKIKPTIDLGNEIRDMFCPTMSGSTDTLENHPLAFLNSFLPSVIYDNPGVSVTSNAPVSQGDIAQQHEDALNRWIRDVDLTAQLESIVTDAAFTFGFWHKKEEGDRKESPPECYAKKAYTHRFCGIYKAKEGGLCGHQNIKGEEEPPAKVTK